MTDEKKKKPLQPMPKCFESEDQWAEYARLYKLSQGTGRVQYCMDCLPEYRDEMMCQGRCAHPETVFIQPLEQQPPSNASRSSVLGDDGVVGINGNIWGKWVAAIAGKRGNIVSPPSQAVRDGFIAQAVRGNYGKDGGKGYKRMALLKAEAK